VTILQTSIHKPHLRGRSCGSKTKDGENGKNL